MRVSSRSAESGAKDNDKDKDVYNKSDTSDLQNLGAKDL